MRKPVIILLSALIALLLLSSCSSNYAFDNMSTNVGESNSLAMMKPAAEVSYPESPDSSYDRDSERLRSTSESGIMPLATPIVEEGLAEKIIYTVSADIETIAFDETIESIYDILRMNNAFIENSYIGGRNYAQRYHGWQSYRTANFTLRVPKDRLNAVTASLEEIGNVTSLRSDAQNITAQFTDTQSLLNSLMVQEERLLDMLRRADDVADMIALEERLSNVRYQIESITSTLRNWQNQVDYSTVNLYIYEVETYTEIVPVQQRTYWQQIGDGLQGTTKSVGNFFTGLFKWFVINLPVLIILAVLAVAAVFITRNRIKKHKSRKPVRSHPNGSRNSTQYPPHPGGNQNYAPYPPHPGAGGDQNYAQIPPQNPPPSNSDQNQ